MRFSKWYAVLQVIFRVRKEAVLRSPAAYQASGILRLFRTVLSSAFSFLFRSTQKSAVRLENPGVLYCIRTYFPVLQKKYALLFLQGYGFLGSLPYKSLFPVLRA